MNSSSDHAAPWLETMRSAVQHTAVSAHGIELVAVDEAQLTLMMRITPSERQPFGLLHGGISMLLAESAASMHACWGVDLTQQIPVGIEINGSHLRAAREGTVRAVARVVRRTRSLIFHQVEIWHVETEQLLCTARVTNFYKRLDPPPQEGATS